MKVTWAWESHNSMTGMEGRYRQKSNSGVANADHFSFCCYFKLFHCCCLFLFSTCFIGWLFQTTNKPNISDKICSLTALNTVSGSVFCCFVMSYASLCVGGGLVREGGGGQANVPVVKFRNEPVSAFLVMMMIWWWSPPSSSCFLLLVVVFFFFFFFIFFFLLIIFSIQSSLCFFCCCCCCYYCWYYYYYHHHL